MSIPRSTPVARCDSGREKTILALLVGACVIGAAPILVRFGDAGPAAVGFWRLVCSVPLLVVLVTAFDRRRRPANPAGRACGLGVRARSGILALRHR